MKTLLKKNSLILVTWLIPFLSSFLFFQENWQRSLVLIIFLIIWIIGYFKTEDKLKFSTYFLFLVGTFNITLTFNTLEGCYKNLIFVNYLCPTLHVVDIFAILTLVIALKSIKLETLSKKVLLALPLFLNFVLHIILHPNINAAIGIFRISLLTTLFLIIAPLFKQWIENGNKIFLYIYAPLLFQLILSILQVYLGRDLNLQFLGESSLLAGTINSSFMSLSTGEVLRGYGLFPHPNVLAGFAVAISLLAMRIYRKRDYRFWIIIVTSILITVLTFSRIHIVLLLVSLSIMATFQLKTHLFSFFPFLVERFQTLTFGSTSVKERLLLFNESLEIIKNNFIFGVGSGEFSRYLSNDIRTVSNISLFQPVHNIFLLMISEYGFLGFLTFIPYLVYILVNTNKGILFISISIFCIVGIGMFDHYLLSLPQGLLLLFLMLL